MSIGHDTARVDGIGKLTGEAQYIDDLTMPGMLYGATLRSGVARGTIRGIRFDPDLNWNDFIIVDHRDIAGRNEVRFIETDQPALASSTIHHCGEPLVLLAHSDRRYLREALSRIQVDVIPLPAILDALQPLAPDLIQYKTDNVFKRIHVLKGSPDAVFPHAAHVIEGTYSTGAQEHVYLEPQGVIAIPEGDRLTLRGSMQCPYYVLNALTHLFNRPDEAFRVVQAPTGGGFGGKEDYPSVLAVHAALLAEKAGAPVKMVYDRHEDMLATTKRHPAWVQHRTAVDDNGMLLAMEIQVILDGGAFVTLSPVVLSRGVIHAAGPYHCDHVRIHGEARLTNTPPNGAFRGFGAPQTLFAVERHMDVIAETLQIDPVEFRRNNLIRPGQTLATQQVMRDPVDVAALMDRTLSQANYRDKKTAHTTFNAAHPSWLRRGIGFSTFHHGAGFTGSGEIYLKSEAWVEGLPDGRIEVLTANTDMGQGTETILRQIAAHASGLPIEDVLLGAPDTSRVPNSGPTVASRTAMVVGGLIERACTDLASQCGAAPDVALPVALQRWHRANPQQRLLGKASYQKPDEVEWDEEEYRGDAYATYAWSTHVAEVEVDLRTYNVRVLDYVALQDVGRVINPTLARGQIAGGVVQGIGWALLEEVVTYDGAMRNNQLTNYIIPACGDVPPIRVIFEESGSPYGPGGAKGIGELPMDGPAPAILNAISSALGCSVNDVPATPEVLHRLMEGHSDG